jgi:hypothetical protein
MPLSLLVRNMCRSAKMRPDWNLKHRFEGAFSVGKINDEQRFDVVRHACPGAGAWSVHHFPVLCLPSMAFSLCVAVECTRAFSLLPFTHADAQV